MPGDRERVVMASPTRHNKPGARLAGSAQPAAVAATPKQIAGLRTPQRPQNSRHAGKVQVQDDPQASLSARWFVPTAAIDGTARRSAFLATAAGANPCRSVRAPSESVAKPHGPLSGF